MLRNRRGSGRLLAAAFAVLVLSGGNAAAALPGAVSSTRTAVGDGAAQTAATRVVTLITGDVVHVTGKNVAVLRGEGRDHVTFTKSTVKGHIRVIPSDARALVASGRLDARLFDVTSLVEFGYDQRRGDLPLLVAGQGAPPADAGLRLGKALKAVKAQAAKADKNRLGVLWKGLTGKDSRSAARALGTAKVWLDGVRRPSLDVSVPLIGAPSAWQAGLTGTGVKVAVLDTGMDLTHPDLAGRVAASVNFAAEEPAEDDRDHVGHGTHVASTIAGSGAGSGGKYKGVAPDVSLLNGKVCVEYGCAESWILAGMQWAAETGADVVNMSLGGTDFPEIDPLEQAVNDLTAQYGTLFVIAAGNDGYFGDRTVGSPASADAALAVAATTKSDALTDFSSRGPRVGDGAVKPEIAAPGEDIVAARSSVGFLGEPGELYMSLSGTSMATPHTAGAAALLVQQHPSWSPAQLKAALMASAKPLDGIGAFGQGAGRVDLARAIGQTITAQQSSVNFGTAVWPHNDDTPIAKTVTYANSGATDVTLQLGLRTAGPSAGQGLFSLSASSVTVPAGGTASVTFTADTRVDVPDGLYSGQLVGTAGGVSVSVPFGVEKEVESYDVTFEHVNRDGTPNPAEHITFLVGDGNGQHLFFDGATETKRVPKGKYILNSWIDDYEAAEISMLLQPAFVVERDVTVTLDARLARPVAVTAPDPDVENIGEIVDATITRSDGSAVGFGILGGAGATSYTAQLGPATPDATVKTQILSFFAAPNADGEFWESPTVYYLAWFLRGSFPTGFAKAPAPRDLAAVKSTYHLHTPGLTAYGSTRPMPAGEADGGGWGVGLGVRAPLTRTAYHNTEGLVWLDSYEEFDWDDPTGGQWANLEGTARALKPGKTVRESWNAPVFGPAFGLATEPWQFLTRTGDYLVIAPPTFSDAAGHPGYSAYAEARTTLFRNGVEIATSAEPYLEVEVPPEEAEYRVETEVRRDARLTTSVKATWTFRSARSGDDFRRLPVTSVTFAPDVDGSGYASPTVVAMVPLTVAAQPDSGAGDLRKLDVQVSTDDGRRWKPVPVVRTPGGGWYAFVPQKAGTVISLRATGVDSRGNTVTETVLRAYAVR